MAVNISNEVALHSPQEYVLLEELREFVASTREMSGNTKVRIRAHTGQRDPFVEIKAKYGDIDQDRY